MTNRIAKPRIARAEFARMAKKDRKAYVRELQRLAREEARRRERRRVLVRRGIIAGVGVVVVGGIAWGVASTVRAGQVGPVNMASDGVLLAGDGETISTVSTDAIPAGGSALATSVVDGVPTVVEFIDYGSTNAQAFEAADAAALQAQLAAGTVRLELHPIAVHDDTNGGFSTAAANALACVAQDDADQVLAVHTALVGASATVSSSGMTTDSLLSLVQDAGAVSADVEDCIRGGWFTDWVAEATDRAQAGEPYASIGAVASGFAVGIDGVRYEGEPADADAFTAALATATS